MLICPESLRQADLELAVYGAHGDRGNGVFELTGPDGRCFAIASSGMGWEHVSVSLAGRPMVAPSWATMCHVKGLFWAPEDTVVQYHPRESECVNQHKGTLHLWRPLNAKMPTPPAIMVGMKIVK